MEPDDGRRGINGLVVSLLDMDGDKIRVTLDDVENETARPDTWTHRSFVTSKSYSIDEIENLDLSEDEFAALGHYVLARLKALRSNP